MFTPNHSGPHGDTNTANIRGHQDKVKLHEVEALTLGPPLPGSVETCMGYSAEAAKLSKMVVWCANTPWSGSATFSSTSVKSTGKSRMKSSDVHPG